MISFVMPTRNRPEALAESLDAIGRLALPDDLRPDRCDVIVVDNGSTTTPDVPARLANGLPARLILNGRNRGTAARNRGAARSTNPWICMLDDDSYPLHAGFAGALREADASLAIIGGECLLRDGRHDGGGLPEVHLGGAALIRRDAFLEAGGYDETFQFYAEEYDLAARLIARGWHVVHDARFQVLHARSLAERDMNLILARLVRNNAWVMRRYAPDDTVDAEIEHLVGRYRAIAEKEQAVAGWREGLEQMQATVDAQPRTPLDRDAWDRFTGRAAARATFAAEPRLGPGVPATVVARGKNVEIIEEELDAIGVDRVGEHEAAVRVVGTLSPGPMLDALTDHAAAPCPVVTAWSLRAALVRT